MGSAIVRHMSLEPVVKAIREQRKALEAEMRTLDSLLDLATTRGVARKADRNSGPSLRPSLLELLEESDRDWAVGELLGELRNRGVTFLSKNVAKTARTTVGDL